MEIDRYVNTCVYAQKNGSFLRKLFPDDKERARAMHELQVATTEFQFKETALKLARNTQIQAFQKVCEDYLIKCGAGLGPNRANFVLTKKRELENGIMDAANEFEARVMQEWNLAEKLSIEKLKAKKYEMLEETIDNFYEMVRCLRDYFQRILDTGVEA